MTRDHAFGGERGGATPRRCSVRSETSIEASAPPLEREQRDVVTREVDRVDASARDPVRGSHPA